ncbi:hypothetical protein V493_01844 [Pseudogymnoascus sp. VKM F-4281 (FW-2241)]|nr:hypothetical protein V493_01844 [Pseudogymnoascus sp. VKM F-4281 (FW-2241)]
MPSTVSIGSAAEFASILKSSSVVITDFYADWCGPCKTISPVFESLSTKLSKPRAITFTKVNVDNQQEIAQKYGVSAMPTFLIFRNGSVIKTLRGADPRGLTSAVEEAAKMAAPASPLSTPGRTLGGTPLPGRPTQSLLRPVSWDVRNFINAFIAFWGLYFTSLFALDAYKAAEDSVWNVNSVPPAGGPGAWVRGRKVGGSAPATGNPGKRVGTLSDL